MLRKLKYILVFFVATLISSCFEDDERVLPYPGEVITIYENIEYFQSYFDLETGEVLKSHATDAWNLGFECGVEGWHILTNSGAGWFIWNSQQTDIDGEISYPENDLWAYDNQSAYPDSTAIGNWISYLGENKIYSNHVYILGKYSLEGYSDTKRIQFFEVNSLAYRFLYKENGSIDTVTIHKNDTSNFVYYFFDSKTQINLEPNKSHYDLVFGPYYDLATQFGLTIPYLVRGVLLNTTNTFAILDSINSYDAIDYGMLKAYQFSYQRNSIGYQWKGVTVNTISGYAVYYVKPHYIYVISTSDNNYYKLRFLSFSLDGNSGYPRFEYKELKEVY